MYLKTKLFIVLLWLGAHAVNAQMLWSVKGGAGTSWVIFPKVFLVDPNNVNNVWQVGPATNNVTAYLGGDITLAMSDHWFVGSGITFSYVSGSVKITSIALNASSRELQSYTRLSIPLIFGVRSSDDFWFTFGPGIFFNLNDNQGFNRAVDELTSADNINSTRNIGFEAKVGMGLILTDNLFLDILFNSDYGKKFDYENGTYEVRLSMQGITVGVGWVFNRK